MTLNELKAKRPTKITVNQAAAIMGVTPRYLHMGLQQDTQIPCPQFPFGAAVKMSGRWSYYINTARFIKWMDGPLGREEVDNDFNQGDAEHVGCAM
ncbi:MAG: hypothetical protein FH749_06990 [Firmicutes bacterium]|nr:hypothetical protein [Bacillota bacterium]